MSSHAAVSRLRSFRELNAERANRQETSRLHRHLQLIEREHSHLEYLNYIGQKTMLEGLESVRMSSGHSPQRLRPRPNDRALKDSAYFASGRGVNERALAAWRAQEAMLERQQLARSRSMHLPPRQQSGQQQQRPTGGSQLVQLLLKVGFLGNSANCPSRAPQRPLTAAAQTSAASSLAPKSVVNARKQRPVTAAPQMLPSSCAARQRLTSDDVIQELDESASDFSPSQHAQRTPQVPMSQMPQWKRQLQQEAPPGLGPDRPASGSVRLTMSRQRLRDQLAEMIQANERICRNEWAASASASATAERRRFERQRDARQATRQAMEEMQRLRLAEMPALMRLDREDEEGPEGGVRD